MKTLKTLLVLAFIGLAGTASAQFTNSNSSASSGSSMWTTVKTDGYNRIYVGYNGVKAKIDYPGVDDMKYPGFSIGYLRGIGLTQKVPLYLEIGGEIDFNRYSDNMAYDDGYDLYSVDYKETMLALKIPVSLAYRLSINDDFAITPKFGFDFRLNLFGKAKMEAEGESVDWNLFDDDEMLEYHPFAIEGYKRFQAGWHIGVGFDYKTWYLGVDYGTSFNEISEKVKLATTSVTVGYNF